MTIDSYKMTDTFELPGKFWLPGQPQNTISGRVQHSPDGTTLHLDGDFDPTPLSPSDMLRNIFMRELDQWPCILGLTTEGQPCSLYRVFVTNRHSNYKGLVSRKCHVHFLLVGAHADDFDAIRAERIATQCSHIPSFVRRKYFDYSFNHAEPEKNSVTVEYAAVQESSIRAESEKATLIFRGGTHYTPDGYGLSFVASESVHLNSDEPKDLKWFVRHLGLVCGMLSLLTDEVVAPIEVRLPLNGDGPAAWLVYQPVRPATGDEDTVFALFTLEHVRDHFDRFLDKWFSSDDTMHEAISLFLSARFRPGLLNDIRFLMLAQSIEAFGRATVGGEYVSEEAFQPIRKALTEAIPESVEPDHREALKNRIKYGYQHSLRKRIDTLFGTLKPSTIPIVCADQDSFVEKVVNMRHYLSHRTDELRELATDGAALYWICEQVMLLLRLLLLKHFGLDEDLIVKRLKNGHRTSQVIAQAKKRAEAEKNTGCAGS
jgi:hypothetical protein